MEISTYPVPTEIAKNTNVTAKQYKSTYESSITDPKNFWAQKAERLHWTKKWHAIKKVSYESPVSIEWFLGGQLNVSYNCIDRHLPHKSSQVAFYWEPDSPDQSPRQVTYQQLHDEVCKFANILKSKGVKKGSRITIYMPMIPEATFAMLACTRLGAIHSVVFAGFSPDSLAGRINDCDSDFVITADFGLRGGKSIALKKNVDEALKQCPQVRHVCVIQHTQGPIDWNSKVDFWYHKEHLSSSTSCPPEPMDAEDPLFILYTSGSTGKPKGVVHTTGGYLVYASLTHETVFDLQSTDVYWCTADIGWVTGHSYIVYGPLSNGCTSVLYEGVPTYPTPSRHWQIIDKYKVSIYYTAPTAIRALMCLGSAPLENSSRQSLRVLGTVGEPINPEAWNWYYKFVGSKKCPIVDTWWQTETGGILITPLPGATPLKPGSATLPFFGIAPVIVDENGNPKNGATTGYLCISDSWPGQMRTLYKDHDRFEKTYFSTYPGKYFTGDGARRDQDGYYWITGRVDDVLNVSGHRLGTAEIESALVAHPNVAEAAIVGRPHDIKGQGIYAYVTLNSEALPSENLKNELNQWVRQQIGPIATLDWLQWAPALPKTRSGKIMRRILRKIAEGQFNQLGDTSTLADETVVQELIENRK